MGGACNLPAVGEYEEVRVGDSWPYIIVQSDITVDAGIVSAEIEIDASGRVTAQRMQIWPSLDCDTFALITQAPVAA